MMKWYCMNTIAYLFFGSFPITSQISEFKQAYWQWNPLNGQMSAINFRLNDLREWMAKASWRLIDQQQSGSIPSSLVPYFHFTNILMKLLTPCSSLRSPRFSVKRSRWLYSIWSLILMLAPISCKVLSNLATIPLYLTAFLFPKKFSTVSTKVLQAQDSFSFTAFGKSQSFTSVLIWGPSKIPAFIIILSLIPEIWYKYIWHSHHPCWVLLQTPTPFIFNGC